jgi:hypothetical protein
MTVIKVIDGKCVEMTPEEITAMQAEAKRFELMEKSRPLTADEVNRLFISQSINTLTVDDNTALRMIEFYPQWAPNTAYTAGFKVSHNGKLWRVLQAHTAQSGWEPENVASLWEQVCFHHSGTEDDPIPYEGNMRLEIGKHYIQDGVIYLCIRDSGNPVYHTLAELVGLYVQEVFGL